MNRPVRWRRWAIYLTVRSLFVAFTIIILEVSAITAVPGYLYLALLPTIGALLVPYGAPRQRRHPIEGPGALTVCVALLGVAAWPWYFYANATAPVTPATVISSQTFRLGPAPGSGTGCITLVDDHQNYFYSGASLLGSIKNNKITLYQTAFGWTPDSRPTQSPTPFFHTPRLNQVGYVLTLQQGTDSIVCQIYNPSGGQ